MPLLKKSSAIENNYKLFRYTHALDELRGQRSSPRKMETIDADASYATVHRGGQFPAASSWDLCVVREQRTSLVTLLTL